MILIDSFMGFAYSTSKEIRKTINKMHKNMEHVADYRDLHTEINQTTSKVVIKLTTYF